MVPFKLKASLAMRITKPPIKQRDYKPPTATIRTTGQHFVTLAAEQGID